MEVLAVSVRKLLGKNLYTKKIVLTVRFFFSKLCLYIREWNVYGANYLRICFVLPPFKKTPLFMRKEKSVPAGLVERVKRKSEAAGVDWSRWRYNDNTCRPQVADPSTDQFWHVYSIFIILPCCNRLDFFFNCFFFVEKTGLSVRRSYSKQII